MLGHTVIIIYNLLAKNKLVVVPHPPYRLDLVYFYSQVETNLKGRIFDTTEGIQVQLLVVLNKLQKSNFQCLKKKKPPAGSEVNKPNRTL
ncbi:hypothetical protein C0J52_24096 [Blattella germanica]|nr:hypothetical protein C0J52_24096 [Blattella germanica]